MVNGSTRLPMSEIHVSDCSWVCLGHSQRGSVLWIIGNSSSQCPKIGREQHYIHFDLAVPRVDRHCGAVIQIEGRARRNINPRWVNQSQVRSSHQVEGCYSSGDEFSEGQQGPEQDRAFPRQGRTLQCSCLPRRNLAETFTTPWQNGLWPVQGRNQN
jgi:hypothetical protein